ncbi:MAG: hypothetical protein JWM02_2114 [Frankiales bacterium]|nr:hypothetical protein [Frankiales bacterium]
MTSAPEKPDPRRDGEGRVVAFLHAGIPLSLLMDLAEGDPRSAEVYQVECAVKGAGATRRRRPLP